MFDLFDENPADMQDLDRWFGEQAFDLVLCTGGNHDFPLQAALDQSAQPFRHAVYLQDAGYSYQGVEFWGSPWVPVLDGHAFFADEQQLAQKWAQIPARTDVLITHTPPSDILDVSRSGCALGCAGLREAVERVAPALHCFGHIHESRGQLTHRGTHFVNGSSVQGDCTEVLPPIVVEI